MAQEPVQERLRKMDAQSIDVDSLSINPYWYTAERDLAHQIIAIQNEKLAEYCAAHGGGYLPSYSARSDHGCLTFPDRCSKTPLKKRPSEYLRDLYVDSIVFT